jgi:hypothetical protein
MMKENFPDQVYTQIYEIECNWSFFVTIFFHLNHNI